MEQFKRAVFNLCTKLKRENYRLLPKIVENYVIHVIFGLELFLTGLESFLLNTLTMYHLIGFKLQKLAIRYLKSSLNVCLINDVAEILIFIE